MLPFMSSQSPQQRCVLSGTSAWSEQLVQVIPDCSLASTSPDGHLTLRIDRAGHLDVIQRGGELLEGDLKPIEPPAMLSWSPSSRHFAISDGEGSGMTSVLRVFTIVGTRVVEDAEIQAAATNGYRHIRSCRTGAVDPDVWALGWSADGGRLYALMQTTVHEPCGPPGSFRGVVADVKTGRILEWLSETATRRRFRHLLPTELRR